MGTQVFVTNKNDETHVDRFNGEEYVFPPGEAVLIPVDAAIHLFGYGLKDKTDTLVRLGWANKLDPVKKIFVEDPTGVTKLAAFVFEEAVTRPASSVRGGKVEHADIV